MPLLQKLTIEAFEQAIKGGRLINSKYGSPSAELNAASAAWLKRIMNVDTSKETTFTIENQGRGGLYAAFHLLASLAGFRNDGRFVVPDTSWPMVSDQLNDFQLKPALYTMARGRYADHIRAQLEAHGDAVVGVINAHNYSAAHDSAANKAFVEGFKKANANLRPNFMAVGGWDGMELIYGALKKTNGDASGDKLIAAMKGMAWESPRGPISIDPETRDIVQNIYIRKVEKKAGELYNVEFATFEAVKDTGKIKK